MMIVLHSSVMENWVPKLPTSFGPVKSVLYVYTRGGQFTDYTEC